MGRSAHESPPAPADNPDVSDNEDGGCMLTIKIPRKAFVVLALLLSTVAVSAVIAAWVTNGSGPGYAKAQTAASLTLSDASASTPADLYPGATGSVKLRVTNSNLFPVR